MATSFRYYEFNELEALIRGSGFIPWIRRKIRGLFLISYDHPQSFAVFKSRQAIANERVRHLMSYYYMIHPFSIFRYWGPPCFIPRIDNIRMDLKLIGVNTRNRVDWAQDRDY